MEALDVPEQKGVGLCVTDITMPVMNGREMVKRVARAEFDGPPSGGPVSPHGGRLGL